MSNVVVPLDSLRKADLSLFGGKAINLSQLIQAGIPVPSGFAISLEAFDSNGSLASDAVSELQKMLDEEKLYAVRSSAVAEDSEGASWAGQFDTFLNTSISDVAVKIEECHNSLKNRAKSYAEGKVEGNSFEIGVVVQEMIQPEYAGVLFTKDPITGENKLITEYVKGLGEDLVSGRVDPERIVLDDSSTNDVKFDRSQLIELANRSEELFGVPQDIEWVWASGKIWLVQARPITATQKNIEGYNLGDPSELFYWGPSRTVPMYMSDFMVAVERMFIEMSKDPGLPTPPKTLVLFEEGKMVWLSNSHDFVDFTEKVFNEYEKRNQIDNDIMQWRQASADLGILTGDSLKHKIVEAWYYTEFAEFALYGAEVTLAKRLSRFDVSIRNEIWDAFTSPDESTFLVRIDNELIYSQNPKEIARKYPWIQDGYHGVTDSAEQYFADRLKIIGDSLVDTPSNLGKRNSMISELGITENEVRALSLTRKLATFMDDRKAWMMQTRRLIESSFSDIEHGWFFENCETSLLGKDTTNSLWQRYINFKTSSDVVAGVVASNDGRHFIDGEVVVVNSPTDNIENGKIIVVPSTSPSYVPLMRQAKALITDHGGIMSHAAIVAREFNLPCIVGTKQATKVLKSGDNVILDMTKGEVIL